ncbi:MAG: hypothetical protein A2Z14_05490 [Chloroflexi bacterium RBG_16_48_8]|nr:MAG: hypothetical protein A2Z14_05490 [Chloroflexi bacterium RBG_16_48_8]
MMNKRLSISKRGLQNWLVDACVFTGALIAILSGIYFLFVSTIGYQGGRNALYEVTFLFDRPMWDDLHTLGGVIMLIAVAIHLMLHWKWVVTTCKRAIGSFYSKGACMNRNTKVNLVIDLVLILSFTACAVSGIYFLFAPMGGFQGSRSLTGDTSFLFSRTTWDLIHTWAGVTMIFAAAFHFVVHWRWIVNVTQSVFSSLTSRLGPQLTPERRLG